MPGIAVVQYKHHLERETRELNVRLRLSFVLLVAVVQIACTGPGRRSDSSALPAAGQSADHGTSGGADAYAFDGLAMRPPLVTPAVFVIPIVVVPRCGICCDWSRCRE